MNPFAVASPFLRSPQHVRTRYGPPILTANCARIAPPAGHYSHVCVAAGLAHVSGQLPVSAAGKPLAARPFAEQVRKVLANLDRKPA
ncbi:hypothetical protein BGLA2_350006 [Burkholderia gladioli]|uniref:RidA family protein n=1 Tax=Burkholderia gladioli TaxID=28095 RepID=UPI001A97F80A|nr:Rid family hydrolase [Burkholderia gladioli]NHH78361.1 hypothetical protein [Burkholderia gladioli]CAG9223953.1 hypothetical protein BGLA2_350006 [Burkholderia gladioli]